MRKNYARMLALGAIAAVLSLSACAGNNNVSPSPGTSAGTPATGGETRNITVNATNFMFDPADIQLRVGDTVHLTLQNTNGAHGLAIPDLNINIKNGETATFTADKPGKYDFNCSIQCGSGHDNMTGTITVS